MSLSTYKAAKLVAGPISALFSEHLVSAIQNKANELADVPLPEHVEVIVDVAFWASLRKEEGHSTRISLAFLSPSERGKSMIFENRMSFNPHNLTKISPGFERPGIHLGVWYDENGLFIWGATYSIPDSCFVVDVSEPGLLVIKHRRFDGFGKFANIAVLNGDEIKFIDDKEDSSRECPFLLRSLLDFTAPWLWDNSINILLQMAVSMRSHRRGGTLLVVPSHSEQWRNSIRSPLHYVIEPAFSGLAELMRMNENEKEKAAWLQSVYKEIDMISGLTAIDGAIIINDKYELLAFGEKIRRAEGSTLVDQMMLTEPILGINPKVVHPSLHGGTRHSSAAQFVHDQHEAIALVASQDGQFTVFSWNSTADMVQAHRIETLLF